MAEPKIKVKPMQWTARERLPRALADERAFYNVNIKPCASENRPSGQNSKGIPFIHLPFVICRYGRVIFKPCVVFFYDQCILCD